MVRRTIMVDFDGYRRDAWLSGLSEPRETIFRESDETEEDG